MKACSPILVSLASACAGFGSDQAPATPQRPTLSSCTTTTGVGTLELETGGTMDPDGSYSLPTTVKWGASERTELFAAGSPWVLIESPGGDAVGSTDLQLGMRHRFAEETAGRPSLAVQMTNKLATANTDVGTGENDFFLAAIADKALANIYLTAFYQLGLLGNASGQGIDLEHDLALAASMPVADDWGVFSELAGVFVPDLGLDLVFTTSGVTWSPKPSVVFDCGIVVGLSSDSADAQIVIGCTYNLGRLFD